METVRSYSSCSGLPGASQVADILRPAADGRPEFAVSTGKFAR